MREELHRFVRRSAGRASIRPMPLCLGMVIASVAGGCATGDSAYDRGVYGHHVTRPSAAGEMVFLPEGTQRELEATPYDLSGYDGRRDASIQPREDQPVLATSEWPQVPRESLDNIRYIHLPRRPESVIYYSAERGRRWRW